MVPVVPCLAGAAGVMLCPMSAAPSPSPASLRVGSVPYLVGRPLNLGLEEEPAIELTLDVPAKLIAGLRSGDLDVALVSSIELFRQPGYTYLPGLAVAGEGYVGSVQLFHRVPLAELRTVALDPASRTAQALVQVLAELDPTLPPLQFLEVPFGTDPREAGTDAWLRIGDPALFEHLGEGLAHYNPSQRWAELTGLPFVFAAWIAREGVDLTPHLASFERAAARGHAARPDLARAAAAEWSLDEAAMVEYLTVECSYRLDPERQAKALATFARHARPLGLAAPGTEPRPAL